ncbi:MAG: DUF3987 domain-containing protein, partial [Bacteroidales bacterium]|nr:DUF3987 domain-containing protein [Bacteroidales bacterium]
NKLISDVENGLFSRFMFYYFEENPIIWKNGFKGGDEGLLARKFSNYGKDIENLFLKLESSEYEIKFSLTEEQVKDFNYILSTWMNSFVSQWDNDASATIKRLGLITFRLAMILSIIRRMDNEKFEENIICSKDDFWASIIISENLMFLMHALSIIFFLKEAVSLKDSRNKKKITIKPCQMSFQGKKLIKRQLSLI